eukprot:9495194-Pyramimonas_sp.AAC.1
MRKKRRGGQQGPLTSNAALPQPEGFNDFVAGVRPNVEPERDVMSQSILRALVEKQRDEQAIEKLKAEDAAAAEEWAQAEAEKKKQDQSEADSGSDIKKGQAKVTCRSRLTSAKTKLSEAFGHMQEEVEMAPAQIKDVFQGSEVPPEINEMVATLTAAAEALDKECKKIAGGADEKLATLAGLTRMGDIQALTKTFDALEKDLKSST